MRTTKAVFCWLTVMVLVQVVCLGSARPARAEGGTLLYMGGENNITSVHIILHNVSLENHNLSMEKIDAETGTGYVFKKVKATAPFSCMQAKRKRGDLTKTARIYVGGPGGYDPVVVEMSDINGFNTTHELVAEWDEFYCSAFVKAKLKNK